VFGDIEGARAAMREAQQELEGLNAETSAGMLDFRLADVALRLGDIDLARLHANRARERRDIGTDDIALAQTVQARVEWADGNAQEARAILDDAFQRLQRRGAVLPEQGHSHAMIDALLAMMEAEAGNVESAERRLVTAHPAALGTRDMPVVSLVGVACAYVALARGEDEEAGELLGAAAVVRGAEDSTAPEIVALCERVRPGSYERGRTLSREQAMARIEAAALRAAPVSG
jgi:hypothetical protein